jgi:hypothetical protein
MVASGAAVLAASAIVSRAASALDCAPPTPGAPMFLTKDCVDPHFTQPYVDIDEQRTVPVPHRYVHGGFTGTDTRFSFYFPPAEQYGGRFFQSTHQLIFSEEAGESTIGFAIASGATYVQSNIGGAEHCLTADCAIFSGLDPAIGGYRANAAAARYSRVKAAEIYGPHRVYGYLYGGSGGAYQTISSSENSIGIWDGYVPFVMGSPNAIPGVFTVRIHALRVLRRRDKFPEIMDAIDPGGSGDPYATLNEEERGALREATRLGFPPRGWWNHATLTGGALSLVAGYVPFLDPSYFDDFWNEPGYLGHDDPHGTVAAARTQHPSTITSVVDFPPFPKGVVLANLPTGDLTGADLLIESGPNAGETLTVFGVIAGVVVISFGADPAVVNGLAPGDQVRLDNSSYLALQTYHRHQVPTRDLYGWNQFRSRNGRGAPIHPQRDVLIGPIGAFNGAGSIQTGRFNGKMIALESLMDIDALPWQADWYRTKVKQAKGAHIDGVFRLWFSDHAQHVAPSDVAAEARTVSYQGTLEQALRDVSAWVERGVRPPRNTTYWVDDETQVQVPAVLGLLRGGIQPVVRLRANGRERADVRVGEPVEFHARVNVPPSTGKVVAAEWDFLGVGDYPVEEPTVDLLRSTVILRQTFTFTAPGTYFPVLRATSQREGDAETPWARVQNIDRVRVVVR